MREINYYKKRSIKKIFLGIVTGTLVLGALILFGLFRVQEVVISGNSRYSAKEIQNAVMQDGLCKNTLYLMWKYSTPAKAEEELPFLSALEVEMLAPYKVQIRVYEKPEAGYFQKSGNFIYFDAEGNVIEQSKKKHEGVPEITGVTLGKVTLYGKLVIKEEEQLNAVIRLGALLNKNELIPEEIKFDGSNGIFLYFDKIRVCLGDGTELEEKAAALNSIVPKLEGQEGTVHMENYSSSVQTVTFKEGEKEEELTVDSGNGQAIQGTDQESESESESASEEEIPTYHESDGTFSTDASGNKTYTDAAGNSTTNVEQYNYTDENGEIITDGYGYIDPYTGAYILKN